jgi:hypothetical protein
MKSTTGRLGVHHIEIRNVGAATLGRIVVCGPWDIRPKQAKALLAGIAVRLGMARRGQARLKVLTACGGFLSFEWPEVNVARQPTFDALTAKAESVCKAIIELKVRAALRRVTKFLSFGIDSLSENDGWGPHVELWRYSIWTPIATIGAVSAIRRPSSDAILCRPPSSLTL